MTNAFAIRFGGFVLAVLVLDWLLFDFANLLFLSKKGLDLIEWLAFWR